MIPQGDGEGGRALSKLLGELRNGAESQGSDQADSKFHRHSFSWGKVFLAGWGALLAGRVKTFLIRLALSDRITTVQTACSCNKVLSSHRGDVRSGLWWAGFLYLVCCVKSQKDFPFALRYCYPGCYMTLLKSYLKSQLTEMWGGKPVLYFVTQNIMFILH